MRSWCLISLLTVAADQLTKWLVRMSLSPGQSLPFIPGILHLTYVQNTGAAFGLFQGHPAVFVVVSILVAGWVTLELVRSQHPTRLTTLALSFMLAGALGNLIDRVRFGYVVDFLDLRVWPVFNLADSVITISVGLFVWQALRPRQPAQR